MAHYRLYFLSRATGGIQRHEEFDAPGDEEAISKVRNAFRWQILELWCGARMVWSSVDADRPARPRRSSEGSATGKLVR